MIRACTLRRNSKHPPRVLVIPPGIAPSPVSSIQSEKDRPPCPIAAGQPFFTPGMHGVPAATQGRRSRSRSMEENPTPAKEPTVPVEARGDEVIVIARQERA